jgi:pimeloyl-ACP methyl ester carboxylesterase
MEVKIMRSLQVQTSAGKLSVRISPGRRGAVLLAHGNSMCKEAFDRQFDSPLATVYRMIAVDLPGHGASERSALARDSSYTLGGLADALLDVLAALDASDAIVCGWSLGGHVALEMMCRSALLGGAFLVCAPPVAPGPDALAAFKPDPALELAGARVPERSGRRAPARMAFSRRSRPRSRWRPFSERMVAPGASLSRASWQAMAPTRVRSLIETNAPSGC